MGWTKIDTHAAPAPIPPSGRAAVATIAAADLKAGDRVRVKLRQYEAPIVGVVRTSEHPLIARESQALFLDCSAAHILRDLTGLWGWSVVWLEIIDDAATLNEDERFDLAADLMRTYHDTVAAWRNATAWTDRSALVRQIGEQKREIVALFGGLR